MLMNKRQEAWMLLDIFIIHCDKCDHKFNLNAIFESEDGCENEYKTIAEQVKAYYCPYCGGKFDE